ncbi:transposase [Salinisphaera sp. G21_0]|nr:transposase [Salinisphaera sp. G21_0]MBO9492814.1 transposase [Thalassotalea sp. G20_0]
MWRNIGKGLGVKKIKHTKAYDLFKRLIEFKTETLRLMSDFTTPFDNDGNEQDVRMAKLKQKISGCYRNRSYLSSATYGYIPVST